MCYAYVDYTHVCVFGEWKASVALSPPVLAIRSRETDAVALVVCVYVCVLVGFRFCSERGSVSICSGRMDYEVVVV